MHRIQYFKLVTLFATIVWFCFLLEFLFQWHYLGQPGLKELSWAGINNFNLVNMLSPVARAYNNIVAVSLAAISLAIPLTANMYTPKLINMFLSDRINQFMIFSWAIGAANILWVIYIIGPAFAPSAAIFVTVLFAISGWICLPPYFFYVIRFIDPDNILMRFKNDIEKQIDRAVLNKNLDQTKYSVNQNIHNISSFLLKLIDRGDRSIIPHCLKIIREILNDYGNKKNAMPNEWFINLKDYFVGVSGSSIHLLENNRTWFEYQLLTQVFIAYETTFSKCPDIISNLCKTTRLIVLDAAERNDIEALKLTSKFFNNYMREAIKRKNLHVLYDLSYQYREMANNLVNHNDLIALIVDYYIYYFNLAISNSLIFGAEIIIYDLYLIIRHTYECKSQIRKQLLDIFLKIHPENDELIGVIIKIKMIFGGYFVQQGLQVEAADVRATLVHVPNSIVKGIESECMTLDDPTFWEVTDRQIRFEWIPYDERQYFKSFADSMYTIEPPDETIFL